ncbi:MAG: hypothetical protein SXA11_00185 [Cyanobacteriota bacterium]|nr:hypothetical protein [Cyanobacteriota bacterium]
MREEIKEAFKIMSVKEGIAMSDWLAEKVLEVVIEKGYYQESDPERYESLAELVTVREEELLLAKIAKGTLKKLQDGKPPEDTLDVLKIGTALGMSAEHVMKLYQKSGFTKSATNGTPAKAL